jgi:LemA protein
MTRPYWRGAAGFCVAILLAFGLSGCGVNDVPRQDEQVKATWSEVLNQYQRRTDLIPNLVATVKGYATQERTVLTEVTQARARATQMTIPSDILSNPQAFHEFEQNQARVGNALGRLLAVSERYPDLKSNENFLALQSQLEGTENRIAVARRDYIDSVQTYNTTLRTIPSRWVAAILYPDAKVKQTFTISEQAQQTPKVQF